MFRAYAKEWSPSLGRDMEILRYGDAGLPILAFPTSMGRFYQWEDFGLLEALEDKIDNGWIQLFCVDSIDDESWYATGKHPHDRVVRHYQYEGYIVGEVCSRLPGRPVTAGPSFGGLHAVLMAVRHPNAFNGFISLSGAFDTRRWLDGFHDDDVYYTNLVEFLPGLWDEAYLGPIRSMERKVIATGEGDPNVADSIKVGNMLNDKGLGVRLDVWSGWAHDWPYWEEMMRTYV